jgi:competence protein ComEC
MADAAALADSGARGGVLDAAGEDGGRLPRAIALRRPTRIAGFGTALLAGMPTALRGAGAACAQDLRLEIERGTAFLLVPVLIAAGALIYFRLDAEPSWAMLLAAAGSTLVAGFLAPRGGVVWFLGVAATLVLLGLLLGKAEGWRAGTKVLGGEISTRLTGTVASYDKLADGRVRLTIDILSTERPKLRYAPDRVRVVARKLPEGLRAGAIVKGVAMLRPPPGPVRPGSYDFAFESYFDGIGGTGFFLGTPEIVGASPETLSQAIENARQRIAARIRSVIGGAEGEIAAALMVGVRAGIPEDASEALRRTGLYHVISISGLHMALVAGTVVGAMRAGFALFPGWSVRRPVRKYAAVAGLAAIGAYLVISGGEVATQRSFIMLAVMLVALLFDRAALTMRNLAISAIVVLVLTPHEVVGPSFQMSFAATAALVGAFAWWTQRREARGPRQQTAGALLPPALAWPAKVIAGLLLTSLVAGLATAPYGAYHFQRVSPLSLFANLVAMPVVSIVVVPFALLAALAMPFGLDGPFLKAMGYGLTVMVSVAQWFSQRSPMDATGLIAGGAVLSLTIGLIVATVASTRLRLLSLPFALLGLATLGSARPPNVLVSEDARLVGYRAASGELAVNRKRPNAFTTQSWERALDTSGVLFPVQASAEPAPHAGFTCDEQTCMALPPDRAAVVVTGAIDAAAGLCAAAAVIILTDPTGQVRCGKPDLLVVTARDLALRGSASILFADPDAGTPPRIDHVAAPGLERPWHRHRAFSREARGLPPWKRRRE